MMLSCCTRCVLLLGALASFVPGLHAQTTPPPPPPASVFFSADDIRDVELSPNGDRVAIVRQAVNGRDGLFVVPLDDLSKARMLVAFDDFDVDGFNWLGNDRLLYNLYNKRLGSADQRYWTPLNSIRFDGTDPERYLRSYVMGVPRDGSNEIIVGLTRRDNIGDLAAVTPMRLHLETKKERSAVANIPGSTLSWRFDRLGEARLAMTTEGRGKVAWHYRAPGSEAWTRLLEGDPLKFSWEPHQIDGQGRLYVTETSPAGFAVLKRWDPATGLPEKEPFVSTPGFDFGGWLVSDDVTGALLGVHFTADASDTVWFEPGMKQLQALVDKRLPGRVNRLTCRRCTQPDRAVLVHSFSPREPGQWFVLRGAEPQWLEIGRARKAVDPRAMADVEFHRIKARDGRDLPVWLTLPKGHKPGQPAPAVVLVHGGPWLRGGFWSWDADAQFLASRGYLVINAEYRGSAGYGDEHFSAGWRQWGRAIQDDIADATLWAVKQGRADGQRVCIAGASFGGYATLMGLVRHPELYKCGAAWVAVTEPRLMFEALAASDISVTARRYSLPTLLGDPDKDAEMLQAVSPVVQAGRIKTPLLLAFGELDSRVPMEHARKLRSALRDAGQEPEYVVYNGEGHSWLKETTRLDFAARLERFLAKHLAR